jgi:hypothetical protein
VHSLGLLDAWVKTSALRAVPETDAGAKYLLQQFVNFLTTMLDKAPPAAAVLHPHSAAAQAQRVQNAAGCRLRWCWPKRSSASSSPLQA